MSTTFLANNVPASVGAPETFVNLSGVNTRDLLAWLGMPTNEALCGEMPAVEVAAKCRRRLWPEQRNQDPAVPRLESHTPGKCRVVYLGRREGYLREKTEALLALCELSKDGTIYWS
jgi:hypothetical protein